MPAKTPAPKSETKHSQKSKKTPKTVFGSALLTGYVPIPKQQEVSIENALQAVESVSKRTIQKPYKCKVSDSITYLVVRRRNVVNSARPWKLRIPYLEIYRYFIFARDPTLVVLVIPEKTSGNLAYLMLNMETPEQAAAICDAIQKRRRSNVNGSTTPESKANQQMDAYSNTATAEMTHLGLPEDHNGNTHEGREGDLEPSEDHCEKEASGTATMESVMAEGQKSAAPISWPSLQEPSTEAETDDKHQVSPDAPQTDSEETPGLLETFIKASNKELQNSAVPFMYDSEGPEERSDEGDSDSDGEAQDETESRRGRAREEEIRPQEVSQQNTGVESSEGQSKSRIARREPPKFVEMPVNFLGPLDKDLPVENRDFETLRQTLLHDKYDDDWVVDMKMVKGEGNYYSHIREDGDILMFAAHHLVPENASYRLSSEGDSGAELDGYPPSGHASEKSEKQTDSSDSASMSSSSSSSPNRSAEMKPAQLALAGENSVSTLQTPLET
ncbi:hypothetical protein SprV_0100031800 [Sparganum proliferum]